MGDLMLMGQGVDIQGDTVPAGAAYVHPLVTPVPDRVDSLRATIQVSAHADEVNASPA